MTSRSPDFAVLEHLLLLASATQPASVGLLAKRTGLRLSVTAQALADLDRAGLVDATRLRLTLPGLAVAVALRHHGALRIAA